jgi:diaminopimelate epimerase
MTEILKAHGSQNDIFIAARTPADFASDADLRAFVRALCDRSGPVGGDGIYFYDAADVAPRAWFFNPDGSSAEFCGNGMRCLGRVILDLRGQDSAVIKSGETEAALTDYKVSRGPATPEGVHQITLEHPEVSFNPEVLAGAAPLIEAAIPELDPSLAFTAVTIPNPHLVATVKDYDEASLIAMGETIASRRDLFPAGANLSVLLPVTDTEVFVRTFERGAGLTASCGSGMAAARSVYSRISAVDPAEPVIIHNAGGVATVSLWDCRPVLTGNATYVYRAEIDFTAPLPPAVPRQDLTAETRAYSALEYQNEKWLATYDIVTAHIPTPQA